MTKRIGVIDIGTLKVKCQVVEVGKRGGLKTLHQSNTLTILGHGKEATIEELKLCKKLFEKFKVTKLRVVSTHALREMGEGGKKLASEIKNKVGFDVEIISAKEEAELFFKAVLSDFETDEDFTIIDVGGGSVQILIGNKNQLKKSYLIKTGTMTLWNKFVPGHTGKDAPNLFQVKNITKFVKEELSEVPHGLKTPIIYGSSCVIELFFGMRIPVRPFNKSKSHPYVAEISHLEKFLEDIWLIPYDEREKRYKSPTPKYMWGIDMGLTNVLTLAKIVDAPYIIPSNANINQGLIKSLL
ncbi:hypothetical protein HY310_00915 [Candidatus Microgenomates bacterium]|nr:hypothetical protein [Candidatus Microgenomates bacterium]